MHASYSIRNSATAGTGFPVAGSRSCVMWMTCGGQMRSHWKHDVHSSWPVSSSYSRIGKLRYASGSGRRSSGYCTVKTPLVLLGLSSFLVKASQKCRITTSSPLSSPFPVRSLSTLRSTT